MFDSAHDDSLHLVPGIGEHTLGQGVTPGAQAQLDPNHTAVSLQRSYTYPTESDV